MEFYDGFDDDYLERLRAGDYTTVQHFCAYFGKLLDIKLRSRVRSPQDVEDIKQTVFVRFFVKLHQENGIREAKCLGSYVISTCKNVLFEISRKREPDPLDPATADTIPDPDKSPEQNVSDNEIQRIVREILDGLPERDRRILRELYLEERDKDEICRDYQITRSNLRVVVLRGKNKFREKMRESDPAWELGPRGGPGGKGKGRPNDKPKDTPRGKAAD